MDASKRLDARSCLYGEVRLSDPQVIALRGASSGRLRRTEQGWFVEGYPSAIHAATLNNLRRNLKIEITGGSGPRQTATTTPGGEALLRKINAAAAEVTG